MWSFPKILFISVALFLSVIKIYAQDSVNAYQQFVDKVLTYQREVRIIDSDSAVAEEGKIVQFKSKFSFDEYLNIFDKLSVEPGWRIDFIYAGCFLDGEPVFIAMPDSMDINDFLRKYKTYKKILKYTKKNNYLNHLVVQDNEDGYFQYAVMKIIGDKFQLFWHSQYKAIDIVCDKKQIDIAVKHMINWADPKKKDKFIREAKKVEPKTSIILENDLAILKLTTFNEWEGIMGRTLKIERKFPYKIISDKKKEILYYNCGIVF